MVFVNRKCTNARHLKYEKFPSCLMLERPKKKWVSRQSIRIKKIQSSSYLREVEYFVNYEFNITTKESPCRMYNLSPKDCERYYLCLMLTQISEATSFEYLWAIYGDVYSSYKETRKWKVVRKDVPEWKKVISKAFCFIFCSIDELIVTVISYT